MRHLPVCLAAITLVLAGCSSDSKQTSLTTTTRPHTKSATGPTTTTTKGECHGTTVPAGASDVHDASADVDGDGHDDALQSYRLGESDWHLHVRLAAGGDADLGIATFDGGFVSVLGGADVDGDGADEIWARTGQGASATILGLARLVGCDLLRVTVAGEPAELPVGGSVGSASGAACEARVDPTADLTVYAATNIGDDRYEVRATEYALDGSVLVQKGTETTEAKAGDDAFARATSFLCGDLSL